MPVRRGRVVSQTEFGRRRPVREEPPVLTAREVRPALGDLVRKIRPMKIVFGAGFVFLGYILGRVAISGFLPEPEFYRVVIEQSGFVEEWSGGATRQTLAEPKPRLAQ